MTITQKDITGVILAGGKGSRFDGKDKGLIVIAGRPMVAHIIDQLAPQVGSIIINANRSLEQYSAYGFPVIADDTTDYRGPLAGVASAMKRAVTPYILTVPCDSPRLPKDLSVRFMNCMNTKNPDICVAHDGQRMQPVTALYRCTLLSDLTTAIDKGELGVQRWISSQNHATADFSDQISTFANINTRVEKEEFEAGGNNPQ
ncbi:MAG: molybdenum cofactor guanylyltransferase [Gammaproteobacteria bacterium]|nr:molybdenum cofactor guanylyltransferase [Gammaproteobacteria bacterium]